MDKSIRVAVNFIRYEYEIGHVDEIILTLRTNDLANPGTKTNGPLTPAIVNTTSTVHIAINLSGIESRLRYRSLG